MFYRSDHWPVTGLASSPLPSTTPPGSDGGNTKGRTLTQRGVAKKTESQTVGCLLNSYLPLSDPSFFLIRWTCLWKPGLSYSQGLHVWPSPSQGAWREYIESRFWDTLFSWQKETHRSTLLPASEWGPVRMWCLEQQRPSCNQDNKSEDKSQHIEDGRVDR